MERLLLMRAIGRIASPRSSLNQARISVTGRSDEASTSAKVTRGCGSSDPTGPADMAAVLVTYEAQASERASWCTRTCTQLKRQRHQSLQVCAPDTLAHLMVLGLEASLQKAFGMQADTAVRPAAKPIHRAQSDFATNQGCGSNSGTRFKRRTWNVRLCRTRSSGAPVRHCVRCTVFMPKMPSIGDVGAAVELSPAAAVVSEESATTAPIA